MTTKPPTMEDLRIHSQDLKTIDRPKVKIPTIDAMYRWYGKLNGVQCMLCVHYVTVQQLRNKVKIPVHKCQLFGITKGTGTDWISTYTACGKFKADDSDAMP